MRPLRPLVALLVMVLLLGARSAAAQCGATSLCAAGAGPCVVNANVTFTAPVTTCDLGGRALTIASGRQLQVSGGGALEIVNAASITLEQNARILNNGGWPSSVTLRALGSITLAASSRIDVASGSGGGIIELATLAGDVLAVGRLVANNGGVSTADGGQVSIVAGGDVDLGTSGIPNVINASAGSGDSAYGGSVDITANGSITLRSPIDVRGQEGGSLLLDAGLDVKTTAAGDIDATAMSFGGAGGIVEVAALRDVVLDGDVVSATNGTLEYSGFGGDLSIVAGGAVTVVGKVDLSGGTVGDGGGLSIEGGTAVTLNGAITTRGMSSEASGGAIDVASAGSLTFAGSADARGGYFAGDVDLRGDGAVTLAATSSIRADAASTGIGGLVAVTGCTLTMQAGATILATGDPTLPFPSGSIRLRASAAMLMAGKLTASAMNRIEYRDVFPTVTGASSPQRIIIQNPDLPCCVGCPVPTTTTTLPTTTTTTLASTTTTTTSSTTTSTTLPASTTTTVAPSTTTTTTLPPPTTTTLTPSPTTSTTASTSSTTTSTTSTTSTTASTSSTTTPTTSPTTTTTTSTSSTTTPTTSPTSTSTTVSSTTTTLAPPATTTTTTAPVPTTTTTAPPVSCLDAPLVGFDAVGCRLDLVSATFVETPPQELGGTRAVHRLERRVSRARRFLDRARQGRKVSPSLKRAVRELRMLARDLSKAERKGRITAAVAAPLVVLVTGAETEIGSLRATLR
ncbi:MAG: hypothetical protein KIT14_04310 [bacterium]|nr:hypothetical protein [bacterium]